MRNLFVAATISTMLTAGAAMAMQADGPARAPMTKAQALARADARFDAMDTDKDGKLSAAEREAAAGAMRDRMGERQGRRQGDMAQRRGGGQAGGRMLARIDTNGDGFISREENRAGAEAAFARMDTNGNGTIDADERRGPQARAGQREQGKKMGRHGGGARQGGIAAMMGDSNRDGTITRAEYDSQSAERFAMFDTNKDGRIDPTEIKARRDQMVARMQQRRGNTPPSPAAPQGE
jgi:Ca2+-binding EF-hand superfamily protein